MKTFDFYNLKQGESVVVYSPSDIRPTTLPKEIESMHFMPLPIELGKRGLTIKCEDLRLLPNGAFFAYPVTIANKGGNMPLNVWDGEAK